MFADIQYTHTSQKFKLMRYSTGADPTAYPTTVGSAAKVKGWGQKSTKKGGKNLARFHLPNRM